MSSSTRVLLIADTHLGPGQADRLIDRLSGHLAQADVILHAGDITDGSVLDALAAFASVHAVLGNNDHGIVLPERLEMEVGGCTIAMVHDSGDSARRNSRLRQWFPNADAVVFGHSHIPWNVQVVDPANGHVQHHINPGSALQRRRQPSCTIGWIHIQDARIVDVAIEPV